MVDTPPAQMTRIYEDGDDNDGDDHEDFCVMGVTHEAYRVILDIAFS